MSKKSRQRRQAREAQHDQERLVRFRRAHPPEAMRQSYAHIQAHAVLEILSEGRTAAKAVEIGGNAHEALAWNVSQLLPMLPEQPACQAGCAWCCTLPVEILPPEALLMAAYLQEALAPEDFAALRTRIAEQAARLAGMSLHEHAEQQMPCSLLRDNHCMVYPARPSACQGWMSLNSKECALGAGDPWHSTVQVVLPVLAMSREVREGFRIACGQAGLDAHNYELHSALSCALETPNAAQRWIQGEAIFAHCTQRGGQ